MGISAERRLTTDYRLMCERFPRPQPASSIGPAESMNQINGLGARLEPLAPNRRGTYGTTKLVTPKRRIRFLKQRLHLAGSAGQSARADTGADADDLPVDLVGCA